MAVPSWMRLLEKCCEQMGRRQHEYKTACETLVVNIYYVCVRVARTILL
jgi:hypothetical protein